MTFNWLLVLFLAPLVGAVVVTLLPKGNPTLAKQVGLGERPTRRGFDQFELAAK